MRIPTDNPLTVVPSTVPGIAGARGTQVVAGTIRGFNATTYEATVQIAGSAATYLAGIPANLAIPIRALRAGARCAVAFFNPADPADACLLAVFGRPPYRDDPDYFVLGSICLNHGVLCGSNYIYLNRDTLNGGVLG